MNFGDENSQHVYARIAGVALLAIILRLRMLNCDVILALALFALLKPVNEILALLGAFWRIGNAT